MTDPVPTVSDFATGLAVVASRAASSVQFEVVDQRIKVERVRSGLLAGYVVHLAGATFRVMPPMVVDHLRGASGEYLSMWVDDGT